MNNNILKNNEYAKIWLKWPPAHYRIFFFFWGLDAPRPDLIQMLYSDIFQKALNVWTDICVEVKHVGTHFMGQLKNKCAI